MNQMIWPSCGFWFMTSRFITVVITEVLFAFSADVFPASQRTLISGALNAAGNIGAALGGLMSGVVGPTYGASAASAVGSGWVGFVSYCHTSCVTFCVFLRHMSWFLSGWRLPFTIIAIPTLVCAALVRLCLSDPRTQQKAVDAVDEDVSDTDKAKISNLPGSEKLKLIDVIKLKIWCWHCWRAMDRPPSFRQAKAKREEPVNEEPLNIFSCVSTISIDFHPFDFLADCSKLSQKFRFLCCVWFWDQAFSAWMGGTEIRGEGLSMEDLVRLWEYRRQNAQWE